jgi:hypothetical protein
MIPYANSACPSLRERDSRRCWLLVSELQWMDEALSCWCRATPQVAIHFFFTPVTKKTKSAELLAHVIH